jgi:hypothetical protein
LNPDRNRTFSVLQNYLYQLWGPPSLLSCGYYGSSLGVKQLGHEAELSPPSCAEVRMSGAVSIFPLYAFMGMTGTT